MCSPANSLTSHFFPLEAIDPFLWDKQTGKTARNTTWKMDSLTPQQRKARTVLLRLPVEILFHFWGVVLAQEHESYELVKTALHAAPELAWSVQIITDDVGRCASTYPASVHPRITSLGEHEQETRTQRMRGQQIRRLAVLFGSDRAVRSGELSAYEGCRYARLFFSPSVTASYCLLSSCQGIRSYTEVLLLRFQSMEAKLRIVYNHPSDKAVEEEEEVEDICGPLETSTVHRSKATGKILDYRVAFPEECRPTDGTCDPDSSQCYSPEVALDYDHLAPAVHVSFEGIKAPLISYPEPSLLNLELNSRRREFEGYKNSTFSVTNLSWSLSNPQGATPCWHSTRFGQYEDQDCYNILSLFGNSITYFTFLYKRIWYYGISPLTMGLTMTHPYVEEIVWFRLSPKGFSHSSSCQRETRSSSLKRLALFSELRTQYPDYRSIPVFKGSKAMDRVQLVALEKSDMPWEVGKILSKKHVLGLRSLELLQLRNTSRAHEKDAVVPYLTIDWEQLSFVTTFVEELTIGGYIPAFALAQGPDPPEGRIFSRLSVLCLDVASLITTHTSRTDTWYELCLLESVFPSLTRLYLKGVVSMSLGLDSYPKLALTQTCTTLDLSSVIRTKVMVNDTLMEIPDSPVVADTFNRWRLSQESGHYVYGGTGFDTLERRIEEVDEALRPI